MVRGPKKHQKRLAAPNHWMLDKLSGVFAPKASAGPHNARECLPLVILLRNRLKYALTRKEVVTILQNRDVLVDGKTRTDPNFPSGFMDVITIPKLNENFRLLYDTKGRFAIHHMNKPEEAKYKLCRVKKVLTAPKGVPFLVTHDGRTIRYPPPEVKSNDTVKVDIETGKITDFLKYELGQLCMITGGHNIGRVGVLMVREKHLGSYEIAHVKDAAGRTFATRTSNVFVIGLQTKPWISLPKKGKGVKLSILEEAQMKQNKAKKSE